MRLQRPKYTKLNLFFAKCTCLGGFEERLFFRLHFHFFLGSGRPFFVGCYVSLKLRYVSLKLRIMRGPGGICNGIIIFIYKIPLFLTLLSFIGSSAPERCSKGVTFAKIAVCNGAQRTGPRVGEKNCFWGGKTRKNTAKFFLRLRDIYKKYILQKNWAKTVNLAFSSGQSNLPPSYMGSQPPTRWSTQKSKYE